MYDRRKFGALRRDISAKNVYLRPSISKTERQVMIVSYAVPCTCKPDLTLRLIEGVANPACAANDLDSLSDMKMNRRQHTSWNSQKGNE
jgi:hypothetical protein